MPRGPSPSFVTYASWIIALVEEVCCKYDEQGRREQGEAQHLLDDDQSSGNQGLLDLGRQIRQLLDSSQREAHGYFGISIAL